MYVPATAPEIVEKDTLMKDAAEESLPGPIPAPSPVEVTDEVMGEEGGTLPSREELPETPPVPPAAPMEESGPEPVAGTRPSTPQQEGSASSRRASLFKRRRPVRPATSDTSAERQAPPWKKPGLFRRAADLGDSSMDDELNALHCAIQVVDKLPGPSPAENCKLLAPVTQNLPAGQAVEVPLRLNLGLPAQWKIDLKEANSLTSKGVRLLGGARKPGQPDGLTLFLANTSDQLFRIQQGQRIALARIHHDETLPALADPVEASCELPN